MPESISIHFVQCVLLSVTVRLNQLFALSGMSQRTQKQSPTQDKLIYSSLEDVFTMWQCSSDKFRISYANSDYKLCASYPEAAIVPKAISDEDLKKVKGVYYYSEIPVDRL